MRSLTENSHLSLNVRGRQLPTPPIYRAALLQACESDPFRKEVLPPTTCSVLRSTFSNFPYRRGSLPGSESFFSSLFSPGERNKAENCEKKKLFNFNNNCLPELQRLFFRVQSGFLGDLLGFHRVTIPPFAPSLNILPRLGNRKPKVESRAGCLTKSGYKLLSRSLVASKFQIA